MVDVKSTGLFHLTDPVLQRNAASTTDYWKTGHSHIKRRVRDLRALAGFEKSGHFFFNAPVGRGYDDGVVTAIAGDRHARSQPRERPWPQLYRGCAEDLGLADHVAALRRRDQVPASSSKRGLEAVPGRWKPGTSEKSDGTEDHATSSTVNGVRVTVGRRHLGPRAPPRRTSPNSSSWWRARCRKRRMREMFKAVDGVLRENPEVGAYNQSL